MARKKEKLPYRDVDGLNIAIDKLAEVAPEAFDDILEQAYALLMIHYPNLGELAALGLVTEGAAARAARMLIAKARADGEADDEREAEEKARLRARAA